MNRFALLLALLLVPIGVACNRPKAEPPPSSSAAEPSIAKVVVDDLQDARRDTATNEAKMLRSAAQMYIAAEAKCPADAQALADAKMIPKLRNDPWGASYVVACTDMGATLSVTSAGPDGKAATADDVVIAKDEP